MAELRALCPACRRPLDEDLAAAACGHVFHRACLLREEGLQKCPSCDDAIDRGRARSLYGVSFGPGLDPGAAQLAASLLVDAGGDGDDDDDDDVVLVDRDKKSTARAVAEILALRDVVHDQRRGLALAREELTAARAQEEKQSEKVRAQEKTVLRQAEDRQQHSDQIEATRQRHTELIQELNQLRLRDTVLEYDERLREVGGEGKALEFLTKMVSILPDPWKVITDMARLRNYHRKVVADWLKESGSIKQRLSRARSELEEQQRAVATMEASLKRSGALGKRSSSQGALAATDGVVKRAHTMAGS